MTANIFSFSIISFSFSKFFWSYLKHALEYAAEMGHIVESAFVTDLLDGERRMPVSLT